MNGCVNQGGFVWRCAQFKGRLLVDNDTSNMNHDDVRNLQTFELLQLTVESDGVVR